MKIALVEPKNTAANKLYYDSVHNFQVLNDYDGYSTKVITHKELDNSYDGYVFTPDHLDHPIKAQALLDNKPTVWISGDPFDCHGNKYVRVLFNGTTPNFGTWDTSCAWESFGDKDYIKLTVQKFDGKGRDVAVITPNNLHTDITFGEDMGLWVQEVLHQEHDNYEKIIVKAHPKVKFEDRLKYDKFVADIKAVPYPNVKFQPASRSINLPNMHFETLINYTSTASVEAYFLGKTIVSWSPGDFMWRHNFKDISACVWKPEDINLCWKYNQHIFENVERDFPSSTEFGIQVLKHLKEKAK